jgi:hypothetical protein
MAIERFAASLGVPALVGQCFRGDEPASELLFVLRDDGLYMQCTHDDSHEIKIA